MNNYNYGVRGWVGGDSKKKKKNFDWFFLPYVYMYVDINIHYN